MVSLLQRGPLKPGSRAEAFATAHFGSCATHRREAAELHRAVEDFCAVPLDEFDPEVSIGELLASNLHPLLLRFRARHPVRARQGIRRARLSSEFVMSAMQRWGAESIKKALLGSKAPRSTWDARTVLVRSVRGVVNERVRHAGDCSCVEERGRRTES
jgi:hypothetical protein